jgi:isocitrate dehydrogenase
LLGAVQMLVHLGLGEAAERVHNAWLSTLEQGIHTYDIFKDGISKRKVGTREFARAVAARLGERPEHLPAVNYAQAPRLQLPRYTPAPPAVKTLVGVDIFLDEHNRDVEPLAHALQEMAGPDFELAVITNRGVKVWPEGLPETFCTDHWRCRFMARAGRTDQRRIAGLIQRIGDSPLQFIKCETLCEFDGERGFSLAQGQ